MLTEHIEPPERLVLTAADADWVLHELQPHTSSTRQGPAWAMFRSLPAGRLSSNTATASPTSTAVTSAAGEPAIWAQPGST